MSDGDPRTEILRLERQIEDLTEVIEGYRKIILISKIAVASGGIWPLAARTRPDAGRGGDIDENAAAAPAEMRNECARRPVDALDVDRIDAVELFLGDFE
jgi:hypothetical protein